MRQFGERLKQNLAVTFLLPGSVHDNVSEAIEKTVQEMFLDRDTKYAELAAYLWGHIAKDPIVKTLFIRLFYEDEHPEMSFADFEEDMKMMLTRRIYDFFYGEPK